MNGSGTAPGPVWLAVSSSLNAFRACKRFSPALTIAELKCKLELVVGSPASCMELELFGAEDEPLGSLDSDEALLGSYPVTDGCRLHVTDRSGARAGQFEDVSQVAKYEMAESDYDKRTESLRSWGCWDREQDRERDQEWEQDQDWDTNGTGTSAFPVPRVPPLMSRGVPAESVRSFLRQRSWGRWDREQEWE